MQEPISAEDGKRALRDHVVERAYVARRKHGPLIDYAAIQRVLDDREITRYPVGIRFDETALQPGEFAHIEPLGEHPRQGFCLFIHPSFQSRTDLLPALIAYYIPPVNYGDITESEDCEAFGAVLLSLDVDTYYDTLCAAADSVA